MVVRARCRCLFFVFLLAYTRLIALRKNLEPLPATGRVAVQLTLILPCLVPDSDRGIGPLVVTSVLHDLLLWATLIGPERARDQNQANPSLLWDFST